LGELVEWEWCFRLGFEEVARFGGAWWIEGVELEVLMILILGVMESVCAFVERY
jgi:hypothetical protein